MSYVYTVDEYVKYRMTQKPDIYANTGFSKEELRKLAKTEYSINDLNSKASKEQIYEKIIEKESVYNLARKYKIGALYFQYQDTFGLNRKQIQELEKCNYLKVIGKQSVYNNSIYDIEQYEKMTLDEMLNALRENGIDFSENSIKERYNENFEFCKYENVLKRKKEYENEMAKMDIIEEFAENPQAFK